MTGNSLDWNKTISLWHLIDKKFGTYLNKPEFETVTTINGACLQSDSAWNQSGFKLSAQ